MSARIVNDAMRVGVSQDYVQQVIVVPDSEEETPEFSDSEGAIITSSGNEKHTRRASSDESTVIPDNEEEVDSRRGAVLAFVETQEVDRSHLARTA